MVITSGRDNALSISPHRMPISRVNLWRLFAGLRRIDDEFERIRVLILFHQLQIGEPLGTFESFAVGELWLGSFDQLCRYCILTVCHETVGCFDNLRFGEAQILNEKVRTICPAG